MTDFSNDLKHHEKGCCKAHRSTESALDRQVGSTQHYKNFKIQPWTFIRTNNLNPLQANIIKYVCRYIKKGKPVEDLEKIIKSSNEKNASILTTEKDFLRIDNEYQKKINYVKIFLKINEINKFKNKLLDFNENN